ncbi:putative proton-dependent oligopeptide transporter family, MFS transporter superfamily [Helianthus annuus]|nr:putative proton-dependent oligopeptide transporter family, MFS transporter superfamily [Helianthus annuus]KAJ0794157.1 putative proton-dependent oligopeptide transporter family, MFS transporter superfamily [Helianthus annuus]
MILILCLRAVNEAFEKVASYGLLPNMILYLTEVYNMQAVTGATILYIWSAFSNGLSLFGAFVSDSYLGPFRVIACGSLSTLLVSQNLCFFFFFWNDEFLGYLTLQIGEPSFSIPARLCCLNRAHAGFRVWLGRSPGKPYCRLPLTVVVPPQEQDSLE